MVYYNVPLNKKERVLMTPGEFRIVRQTMKKIGFDYIFNYDKSNKSTIFIEKLESIKEINKKIKKRKKMR